jgi:diguanylate cyclase (GGDEF)-like protein
MPINLPSQPVPPRALGFSVLALAIPVLGDLVLPGQVGPYGPLLWLSTLVPAFLLAYYRGWRGVATALATGMATLSVTQAVALAQGRAFPDLLFGVVVGYIAISLGIGWLAEALHGDRAEVEDMAFTDLLTRLPNRRHARFFLENEFAAAERGRDLSVVVFDLDHFKQYNDQFGHPAGDEALVSFADILRVSTRRMDLSARFGGEEFVTILASSDTEGALAFADRVRLRLANTSLPTASRLTVSAGVATYHPSMRAPDELLAAADSALYESKRGGRNRVRRFGHDLLKAALPSADATDALPADVDRAEPTEYPRDPDDMGRIPPPLTLLPHQLTGFGEGRRVLLVEDDEAVRRMVGNYLAREKFAVSTAVDVRTGVATLDEEFDVVVVDLRLPGPFGTELIRASKSRWPATQVVVITGLNDPTVVANALAAGADRYVLKPFGMPELRKHLMDALDARESLKAEHRPDDETLAPSVLDELSSGVTHVVAATLAKHPFLSGQAPLSAGFAARIAGASGLDADLDAISEACRLCLVGNLRVSAHILGKSTLLAPDELLAVQQHPIVGREMLHHLVDDAALLGVVRWHHERWDGSGYPDGLAGNAIPPTARLVALSEALAAMTSARPHRPALAWQEAVDEVNDAAGSHFAPDLVEAMNRCLGDLADLPVGADRTDAP